MPVSPESSVLMAGDEGLALTTRVGPPARNVIYFVMVDRFANGDPSNDTGAGGSGPLVHGFDPTKPDFYHGGDLVGLQQKLDYIQGRLGATALWLTPVLANKPVQMDGDEVLTTGYPPVDHRGEPKCTRGWSGSGCPSSVALASRLGRR